MPADRHSSPEHPDPVTLLEQSRWRSDAGDHEQAVDLCERAIALWPDIRDAYRLRYQLALALDDRDGMLSALENLLRHDADDADVCATLGGMLCADGAFTRAAVILRPVAARLGDRGDALLHFTTALAHTGAWDELRALQPVLDAHAVAAPSPYPPYAHLAAARLAGAREHDRLLAVAADLQASPRWLDLEAVLSLVAGAIAARRPFSMLRLDAPLSLFVARCGRTTGLLLRPQERLASLDSVWSGWFGASSAAIGDETLAALGSAVLGAIGDADIVAMPGADALRHDVARFGFLVEMQRLVLAGTDAVFAETDVAAAMHRQVPYLRTVLAGLPFLGFVGAHPAMFRKLAHFCGVSDVLLVPVPREAVHAVGEDGIDPVGFLPDGHAATLAALVVPFPGAVFLVSAPGPLGLVYAGRIRALGGIALDLGPLVAHWAGA